MPLVVICSLWHELVCPSVACNVSVSRLRSVTSCLPSNHRRVSALPSTWFAILGSCQLVLVCRLLSFARTVLFSTTTMAIFRHADSPISPSHKRALSPDPASPQCSSPKKLEAVSDSRAPSIRSISQPILPSEKRRTSLDKSRRRRIRDGLSMSSQSGSRPLPAQMPSFMSVFGEETNKQQLAGYSDPNVSATRQNIVDRAIPSGDISSPSPVDPTFSAFHHQPRGSTSTSDSDHSSDTSPTTTISTVDSVSMSDTSPSVSPDSPPSNMSPASYSADSLRLRRGETDSVLQGVGLANQQPLFSVETSRPASSGKRARNLKNLAVNTSQSYSLGKAISTAQFPLGGSQDVEKPERTSAPASPAFIKPPTPPKKRPTNLGLSIKTPALNTNLPALTIPPTPSFNRPGTLRHFQSSPSLPLCTPSLPPTGGMQLPPLRPVQQARAFAEIPMEDEEEEDDDQNFDVPQSREDKPESYPDGPIRIYESGVDLYFEPTAEIASNYDVVMNVASEVKNPFQILPPPVAPAQLSANVGVLKKESHDKSSPTTPKATPLSAGSSDLPAIAIVSQPQFNRPEYIHIPWEHNTDIVADLLKLVKVIDSRVQQGKRVLVHCQCGVSRSASLIVAYGLFKNPEFSVQEAYDAVKKRSKWIGPNMGLIMQLQEFKAQMQKLHSQPSNNLNLFPFPRKLSTAIGHGSTTIDPTAVPNTAPLQPDASPQRASTGNIPMSAGPLRGGTAPLSFFDPSFRRSWDSSLIAPTYDIPPPLPQVVPGIPYVDTKGQVIPMGTPDAQSPQSASKDKTQEHESQHFQVPKRVPTRKSVPNFSRVLPLRAESDTDQIMENNSINETLMSPRSRNFGMTSVHQPVQESTFNLFSPMATEFPKDFPLQQQPSRPAPLATSYAPSDAASPVSDLALTPLSDQRTESDDMAGIFSPMATHFPTDLPIPAPQQPRQDSFVPVRNVEMGGLNSPRSEEFGMVGFSTMNGGDDGFGIMSPTATEFPKDPWAALRPSIRPSIETSAPSLQRERSQTPHASDYERRPSTPPALTDASSPDPDATPSPPPTEHLGTPPRGLKTRFSSPNLAEQRRLHQIQTKIESQLPRASSPDEDVLMSPREIEFTANPFHVGIGEDEEVRDKVPAPGTPEKNKADPRSPPQLGISPITRNIFDVL